MGTSRHAALLEPGAWRPVPEPSWLSEPFWEAAAGGRLVVQRCDDCGAYVFRPEFACTTCFSERLTWTEATGRGTVHSYSTVWRAAFPELEAPYVVVSVEMAEGWYMMSNLVGCTLDDVRIDLPVRVRFVEYDRRHLPFVEPDDGSAAGATGGRS